MNQNLALQRNSWVDVVRGLAILGVITVHTIQFATVVQNQHGFQGFNPIQQTLSFGKYGVEVFFFISGYLLTTIYGIDGNIKRRAYWLSRIGRIWPLWILFLAGYAFQFFLGFGGPVTAAVDNSVSAGQEINIWVLLVLAFFFMLWFSQSLWNTVIPGGWSIQVEVAHYLVFPFLKSKNFKNLFLCLISINIFTHSINALIHVDFIPKGPLFDVVSAWIRLGAYSTFGYFLIGLIVAASVSKGKISFSWLSGLVRNEKSLPALFSIWFFTWIFAPIPFGTNFEALVYLILMLLVSSAVMKYQWLQKSIKTIGKYSYNLYFSHFLILWCLTALMDKFPEVVPSFLVGRLGESILFSLTFVLVLLIALPIAWISWRYFEFPILRFIKSRSQTTSA